MHSVVDGIPSNHFMLFTLDIFPRPSSRSPLLSSPALQLVHNGFGRDDGNGEHRVEVDRRRRRCLESRMLLACERNLWLPTSRWSRE